jgi:hypothetical protein
MQLMHLYLLKFEQLVSLSPVLRMERFTTR